MATKGTLLLLGGSRHQVVAIETAKRLGYRTVLCDYLPDNPGQWVADAFYLKSTTDYEAMLEVARRERVDGIISFGSDAAAPIAARVAEDLGLPTNPYESVLTLSEKYLVRPFMESHGFACPGQVSFPAGDAPSKVARAIEEGGLRLPVVVKPTDASGSKGVTVLRGLDEQSLAGALKAARAFSRNGTLVAEEYIEYGYPHLIGGDIFVAHGRVVFWGLMDCLRDAAMGGLVPVGKAYPCALDQRRMAMVKDEVQRLVTSLSLDFGEMNAEVIVGADGRPYILELGARAGGNMIPIQLTDISGKDVVEASVRYAMGDGTMDVAFDGNDQAVATCVLHSAVSGTFRGVEYAPGFRPYVYREMVYVEPGDRVERLENGSQAFGVVFARFPDAETMRRELACVSDNIRVLVEP